MVLAFYLDTHQPFPIPFSTSIGEALLQSIFPHGMTQKSQTARVSYAAVVNASLASGKPRMRPLGASLDPLLVPVLNPFVEGLKGPIMRKVGEKEREVTMVVTVVGAAAFVTGLALGLGVRRSRSPGPGASSVD